MKRVWRVSDATRQAELLCLHHRATSVPENLSPFCLMFAKPPKYPFSRDLCAQPETYPRPPHSPIATLISLWMDKISGQHHGPTNDLIEKVHVLRDELLQNSEDLDKAVKVLEDKGSWLFRCYIDGSAVLELLRQLRSWPSLALEVFNWRKKQAACSIPVTPEEYAKGITIAGRLKNVDLALELFNEATQKRLKRTSTYNALMGAYMWNGFADKCQSLFQDFKKEKNCSPSIVTYNILISVFGRLLLVDHMEATFQEIKELNLSPNLSTYNNLIAGYVTAWMWDKMQTTFQMMKAGPVEPDINTHLLMLRGYANSGNLVQMEEMYELMKDYVNTKEIPLLRAMICAYCKSSVENRIEKIENLMKLIPEKEYRPWLNVLLIRVYADEDCLERMEHSISEAFEHQTRIVTAGAMRSIISSYFRCNAVDRLAEFVRRAESADWHICRSLYHCKMVMYAAEKRLEEMERVLHEMEKVNFKRVKRTFQIMYKAYSAHAQKFKVEQVMGLMLKYGYDIPLDSCLSL